ncbi:MAG: peptidoglycan-binding protein [Pedobacter sp.]|nr:MAG: peptidoglycan-binding protein [Pedobacter sp.]
MLGYRLPDRNLLSEKQNKLLAIARSQVGVRERPLNNHRKQVAEYLRYVNQPQGRAWCAAFVSWVYGQAGFSLPRTAWSPALFPASRLVRAPAAGDVFGLFFPALNRVAHCGLVEQVKHDWIISIEGNTNVAGSREGDGVYRKWRHQKTIYTYARWQPKKKGVHNE